MILAEMAQRSRLKFQFIKIIFLFLFLAVPGNSWSGYVPPKLKVFTLTTPHFNIHFHEGEEELVQRIGLIAEKVYQELTKKFKWEPWGRVEVAVGNINDISNGIATPLPYNFILLLVSPPQSDSALNYYDNWIEDLFRHEFTHTLHLDMNGGIAKPFRYVLGRIVTPNGLSPGWITEGIATQTESLTGKGRANNSFSEMMLRTAIYQNIFPKIDQMAGYQYEWPAATTRYIFGGMFWTYLAEKYGQEKVTEFMHRYGNSIWFFSVNNKARKTFADKNFYMLYRDWKDYLIRKYSKLRIELEEEGLTDWQLLRPIKKQILGSPTLSPDGNFLIYTTSFYSKDPEFRLFNLKTGEDQKLVKNKKANQFSFSPDGKKVVYSSIGTHKRYYLYYDLHELDLKTKKVKQLTKGLRAFHPDYSPDGKNLVFVKNVVTSTQLQIWSFEEKKAKPLTKLEPAVQFSNPRFSPDGSLIAVSVWRKGQRDIYLYDLQGRVVRQVTNDVAIDTHPSFSSDGNSIFYASDRSGITNIYRYDRSLNQAERITNVLSGVFEPHFSGQKLYVKYYNGKGYDIRWTEFTLKNLENVASGSNLLPAFPDQLKYPAEVTDILYQDLDPTQMPETHFPVKKYNPFKRLFIPRYIQPSIFVSDVVLLTLSTGSRDPLARHNWVGGVTYRTDAQFLGGNFLYSYERFAPSIFVSFNDFVVSYGDFFNIGQTFFEERTRLNVGTSYSKYARGHHRMTGYYYFENRSAESLIPPGEELPPTLGRFSGFGFRYHFSRAKKYPSGISFEKGPRVLLDFQVSDGIFGSTETNEQIIFSIDIREYIPLPLDGHVFALRAAGGFAFGDRLLQGTFRLGSATGEGVLTAPSPRLFPLRGLPQITFSGERALLFSGEYRMPIVRPQRGLGTTPIFLNRLHLSLFADYGTVWNDDLDFDNFLLGVGAEVRGDFVLGYGLPITGRLGYGIIVKGREFIKGLTDPITGASIEYGTLILELGTSF